MTRASLLHILDHVSEISDAEIRELEQLAAAFPYCQTAHILLAKTAHDRGSMLASQRLRRAATYAANRDLLRQLLEQPAPVGLAAAAGTGPGISSAYLVDEVAQPETVLSLAASEVDDVAEVSEQEPIDSFASQPNKAAKSEPASTLAIAQTADAALEEEPTAAEAEAPASAQDAELTAPFVSDEALADNTEVSPASEALYQPDSEAPVEKSTEAVDAEASEAPSLSESEAAAATNEDFSETAAETQKEESIDAAATPAEPAPETSAAPETQESVSPSSQEQPAAETTKHTGLEPETEVVAEASAPLETALSSETELNDLLPASAPPIRPPAEAGISRFEFDLVEPALPEPSGYLLPDLEEEVAEEPILSGILQRTAPAFHADEDLGYALGGGSRLGYDLQPHDGFTLDLPLDAFFEPDALLLAHIAAHRPKPSTSSLDLINRFLKTKPRIKTATADAKPVEEQADLSVRSIQAAPALASESLARIMVKQGKTDKAIEIYERLMTRQPEKKAYFADQIQQLKQPSA